MVSRKGGSRQGRSPSTGVLERWSLLGRKTCPNGAFLKIPKIVKAPPKQLFIKVRHWNALKMLSRSGFEKPMKIQSENERVFYDQKQLTILFLILGNSEENEKTIPKRTSQVMPF